MKKHILHSFVLAAAVMTLAACGGAQGSSVKLGSAMDSLSYAVGISTAQDYMMTATLPHPSDSLFREAFFQGIDEGATASIDKPQQVKQAAVHAYYQLTAMLNTVGRALYGGNQDLPLRIDEVSNAFVSVIENGSGPMSPEEARNLISSPDRTANPGKLSQALGSSMAYALSENNMLDSIFGISLDDKEQFIAAFRSVEKDFKQEESKARTEGIVVGWFVVNQQLPIYNSRLFGDDSTQTVDTAIVLAAFKECMQHRQQFTGGEATELMQRYEHEVMEQQYADVKTSGEQFMEQNKQAEGVHTTSSGLQYKVLTEADGEVPQAGSTITVHYEGRLIDGTVFDSSLQRGKPMDLPIEELISGWQEALTMMPVGSEWEIYIPQELGYGADAVAGIPPYSPLIYKVQLLGIKKK